MATTIPTTTASTRPSNPSTGDAYFETDTKKYIIYDGTDWRGWNNDGIAAAPLTNTYSVDFDGTDDEITIPQGTFNLGSGNWTLSMWVNAATLSTTSETLLLIQGDNGGVTERLGWFLKSNAFIVSDWFNTNIEYSSTFSSNTWYNLLAVKNGNGSTDIHLYVNGTKVKEGNHPSSLNYGSDDRAATIGTTGVSGSLFPFEGLIDEFSFWSSALTPTQISEIYNSGVPISLSPYSPDGWWRMGDGTEGGSGTTIYDMSSNSNNGTLTNGPTFSTSVPS